MNKKHILSFLLLFMILEIVLCQSSQPKIISNNDKNSNQNLNVQTIRIPSYQDDGFHQYTKPISFKRKGCIIQQQLYHIQPQQIPTNSRLLQQTHGIRIRGYFLNTTTSINVTTLKNIFIIAAYYFQKTLTVNTLSQSSSTYPSNFGDCVIQVPSEFQTNGFNTSTRDMTVFVIPTYDTADNYVAAATPCIQVRWPTYGAITYNAAYISTDVTKLGNFHSNIYVSLHQMMHIIALNNVFYDSYYSSFTSNTKIPISQVKTTINSRDYIILPSVLSYVQNYFTCSDGTTGGLLQSDGGSGTAGSHWERKVYYDQLMTPSLWASGLRMSQLTLSLTKDSGFYASVDLNMAETFQFGRGKGCTFARGGSTPSPQFCTGSSTGCDFNNAYIGTCSSADTYAGASYYIQSSNNVCTYPQDNSTNPNFVWGSSSRCIIADSTPSCYQAVCGSGKIDITINGQTGSCRSGGAATISVASKTITCPSQTSFCSYKTCANWCDQKGICVNGVCYFADLAVYGQRLIIGTISILVIFGYLLF